MLSSTDQIARSGGLYDDDDDYDSHEGNDNVSVQFMFT
jgi:hypothetical protein